MNNADRKTVGLRARAIREHLKMTQETLAHRLGISSSLLSHYETGRSRLPVDVATRLAKLGKTSLEALYSGRRSGR